MSGSALPRIRMTPLPRRVASLVSPGDAGRGVRCNAQSPAQLARDNPVHRVPEVCYGLGMTKAFALPARLPVPPAPLDQLAAIPEKAAGSRRANVTAFG
jgi:hypothetical protein